MLLNGALLLAVWVGAKDTYHRNKKAFQTSYILAVLIKILFESGGWGGGAFNRMYFLFTGRWAYN